MADSRVSHGHAVTLEARKTEEAHAATQARSRHTVAEDVGDPHGHACAQQAHRHVRCRVQAKASRHTTGTQTRKRIMPAVEIEWMGRA